MYNILAGLPGIVCHIDDILVFSGNQEEHDSRLRTALQTIQQAGLTLNSSKCVFNQTCISSLGHVISSDGVSQDPQKTRAITNMNPPTNICPTTSTISRKDKPNEQIFTKLS